MKLKGNFKGRLLLLALISSLVISGCSANTTGVESTTVVETQVITVEEGQLAREYINELTTDFTKRIAGRESEEAAANWISESLTAMGYEPLVETFEYEKEGLTLESQNVVIVKKGTTDQQIIVGAHYDSSHKAAGADDNASGVVVTMETAERLLHKDLPYTVKFIFFGAEEVGKKGSIAYADKMTEDEVSKTVLMINLDSLIAGDISYVYGSDGEKGMYREWILDKAEELELSFETQTENSEGFAPGTTGDWSDHFPFKELGIPYVYFESTDWSLGNKDGYTQVSGDFGVEGRIWHTEHDTVQYMDEHLEGRIDEKLGSFVTLLMASLENEF